MSSPPGNEQRRRRFEPWRKVMLAGALLLLGLALVDALAGLEPPGWVRFPVNFVGYGLVAAGFVMGLRARGRS